MNRGGRFHIIPVCRRHRYFFFSLAVFMCLLLFIRPLASRPSERVPRIEWGWIKKSIDLIQRGTSCSLQHAGVSKTECVEANNFGADGIGARGQRMLKAHLIAAMINRPLSWCPLFSVTGFDADQSTGYFRGLPMLDGSVANVYCHEFQPRLRGASRLRIHDQEWWDFLRCYRTPVEEWISVWSNCTGVLEISSNEESSALVEQCSESCHLSGRNGFDTASCVQLILGAAHGRVSSELQRIRDGLSTKLRKPPAACRYEDDVWDIAIHLRLGDASNYRKMGLISNATNRVFDLIKMAADRADVRFHLHAETRELEPDSSGRFAEFGPRLVVTADGVTTLDRKRVPLHVATNFEPTVALECMRTADSLLLTSKSSFGLLAAILGSHRVAILGDVLNRSLGFLKGRKRVVSFPKNFHAFGGEDNVLYDEMFDLLPVVIAAGGKTEIERWHGYPSESKFGLETLDFLLAQTRRKHREKRQGDDCSTQLDGELIPLAQVNRVELLKMAEHQRHRKILLPHQGKKTPSSLFGKECPRRLDEMAIFS